VQNKNVGASNASSLWLVRHNEVLNKMSSKNTNKNVSGNFELVVYVRKSGSSIRKLNYYSKLTSSKVLKFGHGPQVVSMAPPTTLMSMAPTDHIGERGADRPQW
jgi:hypothetical protein